MLIFPIERNSVFHQQNIALVPPKGKKEAPPFCPGSFSIHSPIYVNIYYKTGTHILCDSPDHSHSTPNLSYNLTGSVVGNCLTNKPQNICEYYIISCVSFATIEKQK